ncbi:type II toxin-antitoxin system HigB family toxin [Algoriphagus sp. H41]|uniref:Type II toxin-antitoxin system HigB family toxin n=1 Tax=Algoriphagus oliviformis TaxID=2811231 RepID=A0ABS3C601_9BACT|nr:type II toxin-antitoxin system HigB family toxin [Algoriphagus oliviformis]MBN7811576.1 type II toxin-antitoxin system HigB family toxin [Algoriphagus oliviformis]
MKRIIAKSTLRQFWERHPDSEQYLKTWYETAMNSYWKSPRDVKKSYANASILKDGRIVFNIRGNSYRLIVKFNFEHQVAFIRFIGTHSEYNQIDANSI